LALAGISLSTPEAPAVAATPNERGVNSAGDESARRRGEKSPDGSERVRRGDAEAELPAVEDDEMEEERRPEEDKRCAAPGCRGEGDALPLSIRRETPLAMVKGDRGELALAPGGVPVHAWGDPARWLLPPPRLPLRSDVVAAGRWDPEVAPTCSPALSANLVPLPPVASCPTAGWLKCLWPCAPKMASSAARLPGNTGEVIGVTPVPCAAPTSRTTTASLPSCERSERGSCAVWFDSAVAVVDVVRMLWDMAGEEVARPARGAAA